MLCSKRRAVGGTVAGNASALRRYRNKKMQHPCHTFPALQLVRSIRFPFLWLQDVQARCSRRHGLALKWLIGSHACTWVFVFFFSPNSGNVVLNWMTASWILYFDGFVNTVLWKFSHGEILFLLTSKSKKPISVGAPCSFVPFLLPPRHQFFRLCCKRFWLVPIQYCSLISELTLFPRSPSNPPYPLLRIPRKSPRHSPQHSHQQPPWFKGAKTLWLAGPRTAGAGTMPTLTKALVTWIGLESA